MTNQTTTSRPRLISILVNQPTRDTLQQPVANFVPFVNAYALEICPVSGNEKFAASEIKAASTVRFRIRYMASKTILPGMQVQYGARLFDINAALNVYEQNQFIDIWAKEAP